MIALRVLLGLLIAGQVGLALWLWPELPERIPTHFDAAGNPDGWGSRDVEWFLISALMAVIGAVLGYGVPALARHLARSKSAVLSVPDRERFHALPEEVRVRAMAPVAVGVPLIAVELQLLVGYLLVGTFFVAREQWERLPPVPLYVWLAVLLGTAIALAVRGSRVVKQQIAAHAAAADEG